MTYEYRDHVFVLTDPDRMRALNELGKQGWKLVYVEPHDPRDRNYTSMIFTRARETL